MANVGFENQRKAMYFVEEAVLSILIQGKGRFWQLVEQRKRVYLTARFKREKQLIASSMVAKISSLNPAGQFLTKDTKTGLWYPIGNEKACDKTLQALEKMLPRSVLRLKRRLICNVLKCNDIKKTIKLPWSTHHRHRTHTTRSKAGDSITPITVISSRRHHPHRALTPLHHGVEVPLDTTVLLQDTTNKSLALTIHLKSRQR